MIFSSMASFCQWRLPCSSSSSPAQTHSGSEAVLLLLGDDLVLDLVVDGLWDDVLLDQLIFPLVRPPFDDGFGACIADAFEGHQLVGFGTVDVDLVVGLRRRCGRLGRHLGVLVSGV